MVVANRKVQRHKEAPIRFRFSGHESFACRYAWLPKAVSMLEENPKAFSDENEAMVLLGVGKNMVRSIRFWSDVCGITESRGKDGVFPTELGKRLLGTGGHDPYLEDIRTLWLLHWKLSTQSSEPLFAWSFLLNQWHQPDLTKTTALAAFTAELRKNSAPPSATTLSHHFDVFVHSYVPTRGKKGKVKEDNLDCPLVELQLMKRVGDRTTSADSTRNEAIYALNRDEKPEITPELFAYCLNDFFVRSHPTESTLSFREVSVGYASPGQVLKLPEVDIRDRLDVIEAETGGLFSYQESANLQQVRRMREVKQKDLLKQIYSPGSTRV